MQRKLIFSFSSCGGKNNPFLLWVYLKKNNNFFLVSLFSFSCLNFICRLLIPVAVFEQSSNTWFLSSASGKLWTPAYPTVVGGYHFLGVQPSNVLKSLLLEWNCWGWWLSMVSHLLKCPSKEVEGHPHSICEVEFAVPVTHTRVYTHARMELPVPRRISTLNIYCPPNCDGTLGLSLSSYAGCSFSMFHCKIYFLILMSFTWLCDDPYATGKYLCVYLQYTHRNTIITHEGTCQC